LPARRGWDANTNFTRDQPGRWADVYVLHLLQTDGCDLAQWCDPDRHSFSWFLCGSLKSSARGALGTIELSISSWVDVVPGSGRLTAHITAAQLQASR
jgi:hypothetical protein